MISVSRRTAAAARTWRLWVQRCSAFAQSTVKIGAIYPLSGNAASAGNYSKTAIELAADLVNNGNAELARCCRSSRRRRRPAGAEGRQDPGRRSPTTRARRRPGQNQALRLITEEKVRGPDRRLSVGHHRDRPARSPRRHGIPFVNAGIGRRQPDRARLQVVLPRHPGRRRLRPRLFGLPQGAEGGRPEDRLHRHRPREHRVRQLGAQRDRRRSPRDGLNVTQIIPYSANSTDVQPQVLQLKEKNPDVADLHLLHVGRDPLRQDDEGAELEAGDHDRRQRGLQRSLVRQGHGLAGRGPDQPLLLRGRQAGQRRADLSTSSTRRRPAATLDDASARGLQGCWSWPMPSTARARPSRPRSRRRSRRPT